VNNRLYFTDERFLCALERQRKRVLSGVPLVLDDSNSPGNKHTHASWGMCCGAKEMWPDPEDHLWPTQFKEEGRVAPLYNDKKQFCPFDRRAEEPPVVPGSQRKVDFRDLGPSGCFYRCKLFKPGEEGMPSRAKAVELFNIRIRKFKEETGQ